MSSERYSRLYVRLIFVLGLTVLCGVLYWNKRFPLGLDLKGGTELYYKINVTDVPLLQRSNITEQTMDVIRQRIDPEGRMELDIRENGQYKFYIQLPGMGPEDAKRIEDLITRAGKLRFCLVDSNEDDRAKAKQGEIVPGYVPFVVYKRDEHQLPTRWRRATWAELKDIKTDDWLLVEQNPRVTGDSLYNPHVTTDETGAPAVGFEFRGEGRAVFERTTEENRGKQLAIILDQDLYSAPKIEQRISSSGIIHGRFTEREARDLVTVLRAGQLPADIQLEWKNGVGAQLGEDSIKSGVRASYVAVILVLVFMAIYYLVTGVLADVAVILTLIMLLGMMSGLQAVMTLPGIAGLVLTLGMAVDANVLINERIREESERGKSLRLAVKSGYERAFITILDSNLTTIITGMILFLVGTGPVRGFATTLCLGIIISMFTAIWVTRWILELLMEMGVVKSLHMLHIFRGVPRISFSRMRFAVMSLSLSAIVIGFCVLFYRGSDCLDTDLTGGFRAIMELQKGVPIGEFRSRVAKLFERSDVQSVWTNEQVGHENTVPKLFSIRISKLTFAQRQSKMLSDLTAVLADNDLLGSITQPDPKEPWTFEMSLKKEVTETDLRRMLAGEGYREAAIESIVPKDAPSSDYTFLLKQQVAMETRPEEVTAAVIKAMEPIIASQATRVKIGKLFHEENLLATEKNAQADYVPLQLTEAWPVVSVREAIVNDILGGNRPDERSGFRVTGHGADMGADKAREMAVFGPSEVLKKIADCGLTELKLYRFDQPSPSELSVSFSSPQSEKDVTERLDIANVRKKLIRAIIPMSKARDFTVVMSELSNEKEMDKIRTDLANEFKDEIGTVTVPVAAAAPASEAAIGEAPAKEMPAADTTPRGIPAPAQNAGTPEPSGAVITKAFDPFRSVETIGGSVAGEMQQKAIMAIVFSWVAMIIYLWLRFGESKFGIAAVVALIHDTMFTVGAVVVADWMSGTPIGMALGFSNFKINVTMIAAFMTLIGYSVNDTIVVFDRIRENMGGVRRTIDPTLVDNSVNQTLSRTILTSFTVFLVVLVLYIMGGPVIHGFAFVMLVGVFIGTYSSIFIAAPILIGWETMMARIGKFLRTITFRA